MPRSTDRAVAFLAAVVNSLRGKVRVWTTFLKEEDPKIQKIVDAIRVLTEILPETREFYVLGLDMARQTARRLDLSAELQSDLDQLFPGDVEAEAEADLAAFDAVVAAVTLARQRGLPHISDPIIAMTTQTEEWKHYAKDLERTFHKALPGQAKAAAYRFIVAVTPTITGEQPTVEAVRSHFIKGRDRQ
jgi:hypothetical protein